VGEKLEIAPTPGAIAPWWFMLEAIDIPGEIEKELGVGIKIHAPRALQFEFALMSRHFSFSIQGKAIVD
jgi:hypothetical protein